MTGIVSVIVCKVCRKEFSLRTSQVKRGTQHCSFECRTSLKAKTERFWSKVDKSGECWTWQASKVGRGYGKVTWNGKHARAHRVAWELENGPIPDGMFVCHRCDNPGCVRPDHLFLGDPSENVQDMREKDRHSRGERHYASKLTRGNVLEIRSRYAKGGVSLRELGDEFGVDSAAIHRIIQRKKWIHVAEAS